MSLICNMPNLKSNPNNRNYYPKVVNNQLCNFTNQQVWLPEVPQEINSIEINFEFTTGDVVGGGDYWVLLGQKGSNRTCPQIEIEDYQIQFYTSADTGSWLTRMVAPVEVNTTYVLNAKWNNVDKKIIATLTDKDGTTVPLTVYSSSYTDTTDGIVWEDYGTLCSDGGGYFFNGLFDLSKSYIKINGGMWWKGLTKIDCSHLLAQPFEALGGASDQEDEGGDSTLDKMYQSASADGTTWGDFSEMTSNTVAEFAKLRPFKSDDTGLEGLLTGSEKLALTLTFKYTADLSSSLIVLVGMNMTDGDTTYNEGVMISGNALQFSFKGSASTKMKAVRTDSTYAMKLVFDNSTKNYSLYYKEIGKDNDFVLLNTTLNSKTASSVQNYIQLQNSRSVNGTYTRVAEFDLTDIVIDIDGEVIFSRA